MNIPYDGSFIVLGFSHTRALWHNILLYCPITLEYKKSILADVFKFRQFRVYILSGDQVEKVKCLKPHMSQSFILGN